MKALPFHLKSLFLAGKRPPPGPSTDSPAAKRLKMEPSSQSPVPSGKSTPQPPPGKSTPSSRYFTITSQTIFIILFIPHMAVILKQNMYTLQNMYTFYSAWWKGAGRRTSYLTCPFLGISLFSDYNASQM